MLRLSCLSLVAITIAAKPASPFILKDAQSAILYADATYCGDAQHGTELPISEWSCDPCKAAPGVVVQKIVSSSARQTLAFIAIVKEGNSSSPRIVASFRGSVLPQNYQDDYDQELSKWALVRGRVHRGLHASYASLEADFAAQMRVAIARHPTAPILVTGHSMGAAQAVYAAVAVAVNHTAANVTAIGFGTPRPGDATFANFVGSLPNLRAWAVIHRADTVPQCGIYEAPCNEIALGYKQIATNIWFAEDLGSPPMARLEYRTCDGTGEDPSCEDSVAATELNWDDHDFYLEHSMFCCAAGHPAGPDGCPFPFSGERRPKLYMPTV